MGRKNQFFGVKVGRKPGVYCEWSECKAQILGIEDARWKRFNTYEEAESYCFTDGAIKTENGEAKPSTPCGSTSSPITIIEVPSEKPTVPPHIDTTPDKRNDPTRYRPDLNTPDKKTSPKVKAEMRAMLGLSSNVYNPSAKNPSASTPVSSPCQKKPQTVLDTSNISTISCPDDRVIKSEDVKLPVIRKDNGNLTLQKNSSSVIDVSNTTISNDEIGGSPASFLPEITVCYSTNKSVLPNLSKKVTKKQKPKFKQKVVKKKPIIPEHTYVEEAGLSNSDDDLIEIIENPLKEIQMSQSTSEEFLRVGSTEEEVAVGIFWDIENVRMPRGLNPAIFISKIREKFVDESPKFCEKHFFVVCDVREESNLIMKQLFEFHVRIVHVPRLKANSSDNVIRDLMHEFVGYNKFSRLILISGDSDFSHDIHNFRRNKKCDCILIYNPNTKESMIRSANSAYLYTDLMKQEMLQNQQNQQHQQYNQHPQQKQHQNQRGHPRPNHYHQNRQMPAANHMNPHRQGNQQRGGFHNHIYQAGRFYNQQFNRMPVPSTINQDQPLVDATSHKSLPDYIPLGVAQPNDASFGALSKAYYRKKRKQMLTPRTISRQRPSKLKRVGNDANQQGY